MDRLDRTLSGCTAPAAPVTLDVSLRDDRGIAQRRLVLLAGVATLFPLPAMASDFGGIVSLMAMLFFVAPWALLNLVLFVACAAGRKYASRRFTVLHAAVAGVPVLLWSLLAYVDLFSRHDGQDLAGAMGIAAMLFALACLPLAAHRWQRTPGASSRPAGTAARLAWLVAVLALVALFAGPAIARHGLVQRQAFWTAEIARVPAGASVEQVRRILGHDGLAMACETPNSDGLMFCTADDRRSFGLVPRWRISFLVSFSGGRLSGIDQIAGAERL